MEWPLRSAPLAKWKSFCLFLLSFAQVAPLVNFMARFFYVFLLPRWPIESIRRIFRGFSEDFWKIFGRYLEDFEMIYGRFWSVFECCKVVG